MNKDLTIVLLLKDREVYTIRFLQYLSLINCEFPILIADGGKNKQIQEILTNHREYFPNISYEYYHFGEDETINHFSKKIFKAVEKVQTPFCILADNDDFFLMSGIKKSIEILKNDSRHSSARGSLLKTFVRNDCDDIVCNACGISKIEEDIYGKYPSIIGESSLERVCNQSKYPHSNWHNIHYTEDMKIIYELISLIDFKDSRFIDQSMSYLSSAISCGYRGNFDFILHQEGTPRVVGSEYCSQREWIEQPYWNENFNNMIEIISCMVFLKDGEEYDIIREKIIDSYFIKLSDIEVLKEKLNYVKGMKVDGKLHDETMERVKIYLKKVSNRKEINYNNQEDKKEREHINEKAIVQNFLRSFSCPIVR